MGNARGGPDFVTRHAQEGIRLLSSLLILYHTQTLLLHVIMPSALVTSSQGFLPYNLLWALSL